MKNKKFFILLLSSLILSSNFSVYAKENNMNYSNFNQTNFQQRKASLNSVFYKNAYRRGKDLIVEIEVKGPSVIKHELTVNHRLGREIGKYNVRNGVVYKYLISNMPYGFHDLVFNIVDINRNSNTYKFYLMQKI